MRNIDKIIYEFVKNNEQKNIVKFVTMHLTYF